MSLFRALFAPPRDLILLVLAGWLGLALADRRARDSLIGEGQLDTLVFSMLAAFAAGGRVLYLVEHWAAFAASPASLVSLNRDLFDVWGALGCATIAAIIVTQRKALPVWDALDLLAPLFASLSVGLALSHLASGTAFGSPAALPWSIQLWGAARHPTQLYELCAAVITLAVIWFWRRGLQPGGRFLLWVSLAAASRLIIEGFRGDSTLVLGGLRLAQIIAWLVLAAALTSIELLRARGRRRLEPPSSPGAE